MKKKLGTLLVVFLIALAGGYLWLQWKHRQVLAEKTPKPFLACNKHEISRLELLRRENGGGKRYVFERTDRPKEGITAEIAALNADWRLSKPEQVEADAGLAKMMTQIFCDLYSYQKIEAADLAAIGLHEPAVEVALFAANTDKSWRVRLSNKVPQASNQKHLVYAAISSGEKWDVYLIPPTARMIFFVPAERFSNHRILKMQVHDILKAKILFQGKTRFEVSRAGGDWEISEGGNVLGQSEEAGKYINRIATLSAVELLANTGGEQYCVSKPKEMTVEILVSGVAGRSETLRFSKPNIQSGKNLMRACNQARQAIFGVHPEMWKYLDVSASSLLKSSKVKSQNGK